MHSLIADYGGGRGGGGTNSYGSGGASYNTSGYGGGAGAGGSSYQGKQSQYRVRHANLNTRVRQIFPTCCIG